MDWFYNIQITIILFEISLYFVLNKIWHSTWRTIQFQTLMKFSDHVSFVPFTNHFCNWTSQPFYLSTFIRYNKWINNIKKKKCKKLFKGKIETISFFSNNQIENIKIEQISHFHQFISFSTIIIISLIDFFPFHIQVMSKQASDIPTDFDFPSIYIYFFFFYISSSSMISYHT